MDLLPLPRLSTPVYGRRLLASLPAELFAQPRIYTQPEPWALIRDRFSSSHATPHFVASMDHDQVRVLADAAKGASAIFGVGGGSALDCAKYVAWRTGAPLVLAPTILSVDAAYTRAAGVREEGRVRYVGDAPADHLLIDFDLLEQAPPLLNRAGVGDILSIHTALWDWRRAAERLGEPHSEGVAEAARGLLDRLFAEAAALRAMREPGLRLLSELYAAEVRLCEQVGSARPEEGSEHYLGYHLEERAGHGFIHGQLIGMCVLLVADHQGQDSQPVVEFLRAVGLRCLPEDLGLDDGDVIEALVGMPDYVARERQLLPGVFHFGPVGGAAPGAPPAVSRGHATALVARLRAALAAPDPLA